MKDSSVKEINEMEANKHSNIEFKRMVIRMLKDLSGNYNSMKKEIETINKNQEEMNNKILEIKSTLEGITSSLDEAEDQISELEDQVERNTQIEQLHEKTLKKL